MTWGSGWEAHRAPTHPTRKKTTPHNNLTHNPLPTTHHHHTAVARSTSSCWKPWRESLVASSAWLPGPARFGKAGAMPSSWRLTRMLWLPGLLPVQRDSGCAFWPLRRQWPMAPRMRACIFSKTGCCGHAVSSTESSLVYWLLGGCLRPRSASGASIAASTMRKAHCKMQN